MTMMILHNNVDGSIIVYYFWNLSILLLLIHTRALQSCFQSTEVNRFRFRSVIRSGCKTNIFRNALSKNQDEVELQRSIKPVSPEQELQALSEAAKEYGINEKDVYGAGAQWLDSFEEEIANLLGKEAAMFCPSGVMAQQIALLVHRNASQTGGNSFVCHPTSHLLIWEENAYKELLGFEALISESRKEPLKPEDLSRVLQERFPNTEKPSTVILEIPYRELGGVCTSFEDIKGIKAICAEHSLKLHMDGARIWEAQPYYELSFKEIAEPFDSVYVSFYKGLGGLTGAMLIGNADFIKESRVWLRRFGGNVFTSLPYALSALKGYRTQLGSFEKKRLKMIKIIQELTRMAESKGLQDKIKFCPEVPHCNMVHCHLSWPEEVLMPKVQAAADSTGIRTITRLRQSSNQGSYYEWSLGEQNFELDESAFYAGFEALFEELLKLEEIEKT